MIFRQYNIPKNYSDIFEYNLSITKDIINKEEIKDLIKKLSLMSGIDKEIIAISFQRFCMAYIEYYPNVLQQNIFFDMVASPLKLLSKIIYNLIKNRAKFYKSITTSNIIIDGWFVNDSIKIEEFYGYNFFEKLKIDNLGYSIFTLKDWQFYDCSMMRYVWKQLFFFKTAFEIKKKYGFSIAKYIEIFFLDFIKGKSISKYTNIKLVVSGNDNGFFPILAKSMNADIILIQNGNRPYMGDSCFSYADVYVSMGGKAIQQSRVNMGCKFNEVYPFGSFRLDSFLLSIDNKIPDKNIYDIIFVEGWELYYKNSVFNILYNCSLEQKIVEILNLLASKTDYKIAYQSRNKNALKYLIDNGLTSDNITYFESPTNLVYEAVIKSKLVLSSWSTVCLEAMALNKKVGFVNFSENKNLNLAFEKLNIEWTDYNYERFEKFINRLITENAPDYSDYIIQEKDFANKLVDIIYQRICNKTK